ncbi:alpha/beta fold hydrolase [Desulfosarcina cetonica]|uniref:alpha/beta fold hydrolase n=1 Tax=Desulfosarcina cetonica TaxID=90730 RepID=UPI001C48E29C|nr:alpha/beta fold hydrolase [Desulfosarcina cetonica]
MVPQVARQRRFDIHLTDGGGRLEAAWVGPPPEESPTLVLLHEGLGCVDLWRDVPQRMAAATGYGVLVYSRLGYGRSDPCALPRPIRFMHDEGLIVLPLVLRAAGIREHILVGHSDGGSIALIHAGRVPGPGLKGVVTLAAHVFARTSPAVPSRMPASGISRGISNRAWPSITATTPIVLSGVGMTSGCIRSSSAGISRNSCRPSPCRCWPSRARRTLTAQRPRSMRSAGKRAAR